MAGGANPDASDVAAGICGEGCVAVTVVAAAAAAAVVSVAAAAAEATVVGVNSRGQGSFFLK